MPRRGTYVQQLRQDAEVIYVDVGGAPAGVSEYDRLKFEAVLNGEAALQVAAHNLGAPELRLGAEYLRDLGAKHQFPFVTCNAIAEDRQPLGIALRVIETQGRRLGITGVVSPSIDIEGFQIDPPLDALLTVIDQKRGQYDSLVVLAYLSEAELTKLANSLPEADLVIGGPTGQSILPRRAGPVLLAAVTNKGKFVAEFMTATDSAGGWKGKVVELDGAFSDQQDQMANVEMFRTKLAKLDLPPGQTSFADDAPIDPPPEGFSVAGSDACQECHREDCKLWRDSPHAHAWESLAQSGSQVDPFCQQCHTTGYGLPGGFVTMAASPDRFGVGCESCHGPSLAHVEHPQVLTAYAKQSRNQCLKCHDRENSPHFRYDDYWARMKHGAEADKSGLE